MMQINTLLELRSKMKERKPVFIRQDNPKRMKLNYKWRKPKGIHSKIRHKFKGRRKMPSPGYKSPVKVKGLHASGLKFVNVFSAENLDEIKNDSEGIVVAKSVGMRKQLEIFKKAKENNIKVLNVNADEKIKKIEEFINSKKKKEAKKMEVKEEKKVPKEEIKKETKTEKPADEGKKEPNASERVRTSSQLAEKKEKDKLLTKRV